MARRGSYQWALTHYGKPCVKANLAAITIQPGIVIWADARTADVWRAMGKVMLQHGYLLRPGDTGAYNCRPTTGGSTPSRHANGLACDCNWTTNPYVRTPTLRPIKWGVETDMPAVMVRHIEGITAAGVQALTWGGRWKSVKDAMHWQTNVTPAEIAAGVYAPGLGSISGGEDDDMNLKRGDSGNTVGLYQEAIRRWALAAGVDLALAGKPFTVDESFGPHTEHVVRIYQNNAQLPDRFTIGELDGVTCANLARYVPAASDTTPTAPSDTVPPHTHPIVATTGEPT